MAKDKVVEEDIVEDEVNVEVVLEEEEVVEEPKPIFHGVSELANIQAHNVIDMLKDEPYEIVNRGDLFYIVCNKGKQNQLSVRIHNDGVAVVEINVGLPLSNLKKALKLLNEVDL